MVSSDISRNMKESQDSAADNERIRSYILSLIMDDNKTSQENPPPLTEASLFTATEKKATINSIFCHINNGLNK